MSKKKLHIEMQRLIMNCVCKEETMFSIVFVIISFIVLAGITLLTIEIHNAPLMADDEMTILPSKDKQ